MRLGSLLAGAGLVHAAVNARLLRRPVVLGPHARTGHRVSVLIPARDESSTIGECLDRLSGQDIGEILVLDDGSSDDTAARAAAAGARVVAGTPPPIGWLGKPHACAQLAAAADAGSDVFVFLDADVRLAPGAVAAAVALLDALDLDLVSPNPRQLAGSASERLIQPLLEWSILTFLPVRVAERSSRPSLGVANGQFVVVRRAAYVRAGGHVPDEILDDLALARAVKNSGGRGVVVDGSRLATCRMYVGWHELRDGHTKSLWSAFGSPAGAVAVVGLLGLAYVVPPVAAVRGSRVGLLGYAAGVLGRAVAAHRTGGRVWPDALAHPVSVTVFAYLIARSHVQHRRGALRWKGRALPR